MSCHLAAAEKNDPTDCAGGDRFDDSSKTAVSGLKIT
jgi:hypothetical protein